MPLLRPLRWKAMNREQQTNGSAAGLLLRKEEVLRQFRARLLDGDDWFDALLQAVAHWSTPFEVHDGREYRYLVGGEAFDWLLLAQRLVLSVVDLVPQEAW